MGSKKQEYRAVVAWLRSLGWRVDEERGGYPMAFCPCGRHIRSVHLSPSNPKYYDELKRWVARLDCRKEAAQ